MRRPKVRARPLTGLLLALLAASSALAWMQSRSNSGVQPLLRVPSGSLTFLYEQDGAPSAGMVASHAAWDNARASINAVATSDAAANRGTNFNLTEPIDDDVLMGGVANDNENHVFAFTTDTNNDTPAGVLAFAAAFHFTTGPNAGDIVECDVAFNDADFDWNTTDPDLEGVAVHEFTHCYGISHSAVAGIFNSSGHEVLGDFNSNFSQQATMFPFHSGTTNDRSLHADDIAALSDLYPNATTATMLGTISGNVQTGSGNPVLGAHVIAVSTAAPNTPVVGFLSNTDVTAGGTGAYRLLVPAPGNYFVRVEPVIGFPNIFTQGNVFHPGTFMSNLPPEFYSGGSESASDAMPDNVLSDAAAVTVMAGQTTSGINIVVNNLAAFSNDNFSGSRVISTNSFREAVDNTPATTEGTDPNGSCFSQTRAFTAWYSFTAPSNGDVTFSTEGSHYDTALAAFTGSPGSFSQVSGACSEDLGTPDFRSNLQSKITFSAAAGTTYRFLISDSQFVSPPEFLLVVNFTFAGAANNPVPSLSLLSPSSASAGGAGFTLTVNGSNFINGSVVRWNGSNRTTSFLSANQLQATIPASDLVNAGAAQVTVFNPAPGGGASNALSFNILSPVISGLVPDIIPATSPGFELTVNGSNFHNGSVVRWKGMNRTTMFMSSAQLKATIPNTDVAAVGTAQVTVLNSAGTGGTSNAVTFTINFRNPLPTITGLSPAGVIEDGPGFTLTVTGSNFVFNSMVRFNGSDRVTTFVGGNQLQAAILAGDITTVGTKSITVFSPGPGGGTSNTASFPVQMAPNPAPSTSGLAPNNIVAGSERDTLPVTVNGSNFVNGASVVRWNGMNRVTMFITANQLTATIPASDLVAAGMASVTVFTAGPGGGTSSPPLTFTINNPLPATSSLSPSSTVAGDPGLTLAVVGSNFVPGSVVRWNGSNRVTTFIGNSQLRAAIPASDLAGAGMATVTVFTPAPPPGGQTSNGQTFTITSSIMASSGASGGTADPMQASEVAGPTGARPAEATVPARPPAIGPGSVAIPVLMELEELEPKTRPAGGGEFTLRVRGKNFLPGVVVRWNGKDLPTRVVSSAELEATVPARSVAAAGSGRITVFYPGADVESESKTFTLTSP